MLNCWTNKSVVLFLWDTMYMFQCFRTLQTWMEDVYYNEILITFNLDFRTNHNRKIIHRRFIYLQRFLGFIFFPVLLVGGPNLRGCYTYSWFIFVIVKLYSSLLFYCLPCIWWIKIITYVLLTSAFDNLIALRTVSGSTVQTLKCSGTADNDNII